MMIALDSKTFRGLGEINIAKGGRLVSSESFPTGWGKVTAEIDEYQLRDSAVMTVRLPHLSTFQLFSRPECEPYVSTILTKGCKHLSQVTPANWLNR